MFYNCVSSCGQILTYCYDLVHVNCGFISKIVQSVSVIFDLQLGQCITSTLLTLFIYAALMGVGVCGTKL